VDGFGLKVADLRSRLRLAPGAEIGPPDDALLKAVIVKLFADRQLGIDTSVVDALALRIDRSLARVREVRRSATLRPKPSTGPQAVSSTGKRRSRARLSRWNRAASSRPAARSTSSTTRAPLEIRCETRSIATSVFLLRGPPGSGKSHLASIWATRAQAWTVSAADVALEGLTRKSSAP
jgi:chromosomal replication initiation ATPase DnaA